MATGTNLANTTTVRELAESHGVRECLQWFTREKQWINEQHIQLCRIPAPTFLERKRAEWMVEQFTSLGCEALIDRAGNVVARLGADEGGPLVSVSAHLDTVLAPRTREDIGVDPDGTFRGPGVADNGSGLTALLAIARALKSSPRIENAGASLVLVANVGEEGEGNLSGMRYLAKQSSLAPRIRTYLVLDGPSLENITSRALGSRRFEVVFTGPGGHSWSDYGNPNPIHALSHTIARFTEQCTGSSADDSAPRASFNFGTIEGGTSVNSIPAEARAKLDLRSEDAESMDELAAILTLAAERGLEIENQRSTGAKLSLKIKEIGSRPGGHLPDEAPILAFLRAIDAHLGIRSRLHLSSTDANIPLSMGTPALSIGAGGQGGGAHSPGEWYHPEGRDLGLKRILLLLAMLLRAEA